MPYKMLPPEIRQVRFQWVAWLNTMSAKRLIMMHDICQAEGIDVNDKHAVQSRWHKEMDDLRQQLKAIETTQTRLRRELKETTAKRYALREMLGLAKHG